MKKLAVIHVSVNVRVSQLSQCGVRVANAASTDLKTHCERQRCGPEGESMSSNRAGRERKAT